MRHCFSLLTAGLLYIWKPVTALSCDSSILATAVTDRTISGQTFTNIQAGQNVNLANPASGCPTSFITSVNLCRITFTVATSSQSSFFMEVWMPDSWDGRYISTGNFGLFGCVKYDDMQYLTGLGSAVAGTDGGHSGATGDRFANNLDVVKDYSFRSVHIMTTKAKQIVQAYYSFTPNKSYYYGCSTGGRQGLQSAQMFPNDFDGIIAGSAAVDFNNLIGWSGSFLPITGPPGSPTFLTSNQWNAVHFSVMQHCDGIDGVNDTIIEDPDLCNFDPSSLLCGGQSSDPTTCLTTTQLQTVKTLLGPLRDQNGKLLFPQLQPGVEDQAGSSLFNGFQQDIPTNWFRTAIFNNQGYDPSKLSISQIVQGIQLDPATVSSYSGDLSAFQRRGGKLITTHGLTDDIITSTTSTRYYRHVSATMNLAPTSLDDFYRYFRISGLNHCNFGPGAWEIGQSGSHSFTNSQQNIVLALFDWVEKGIAPDTLLGTKFNNDDQAQGIAFQRNHCRYPLRTTFLGGDSSKAASWNCQGIVDPTKVMTEET